MDFARDGLNAEERRVLDWADGRLFSNPAFLASKWGPGKWPSEVKTASVRAIPLLMLEIDIEKRSDGKHVITWGVDSLDRVLDGLGIYEGLCVSCYGKDNYASVDELRKNQYPIVNDQKHVHREMLKTFAYFAEADGEGILMRSLMENDADDLEMLYRRVRPVERMFTHTSFAWQNQSFMSQITRPDGTLESFPTTVYKIIGDAGSQREAVERWFDHLARIHRRYDVTAAEWAIGAREGDGAGTISGKWGQCLSSAAAGRPCDRLGTLGRARWRGEDAGRDSRGAGWRELAGTFGCPLGGSGTGVAVRQEVESLAVGPGRG